MAGRIRPFVLTFHGCLALCVGLFWLFARAVMITPIFEALAVSTAVLFSAAALILAGLTDWFAVFTSGMMNVHRFCNCLLAGIAFALAGALLVAFPSISMMWLVAFAALHAVAFGIWALLFAFREKDDSLKRRAMFFFGTCSVLFACAMAGLAVKVDDFSAAALLGSYMCFVGVKMLFFAWSCHRPVSPESRAGALGR